MSTLFTSARLRRLAGTVMLAIGVGAGAAYAVGEVAESETQVIQACQSLSKGTLRIVTSPTECSARSELPISWNAAGPAGPPGADGAKGDTGPAGPPGAEGAASPLEGMPCSTRGSAGSGPDGHVTVTALTTRIELNCVSNAPVLSIVLEPKRSCASDGFCWGLYPTVTEVDSAGDPVAGGASCSATAMMGAAAQCAYGYLAVGEVMYLRANPPAGLTATWAGCDSVAGNVCTRTITSGPQSVTVTVS